MKNRKVILGTAAVASTGIMAGLYVAFSASINPAFSKLGDAQYIRSMQEINRSIQNPAFFAVFFGSLLLLPAAAFAYRHTPAGTKMQLLVIASVLYGIGSFGVTVGANVPLNNKLDSVNIDTSSASELISARNDYAGSWNKWHTVRTVATVAAFVAGVTALAVSSDHKKDR